MSTSPLASWRFERLSDHTISVTDPCVTTPIELNLHSTDRRVRSFYNLAADMLATPATPLPTARGIDDAPLLRQALQSLERYVRWAADMDTELAAANAISALKRRLQPVQTPGHREAAS